MHSCLADFAVSRATTSCCTDHKTITLCQRLKLMNPKYHYTVPKHRFVALQAVFPRRQGPVKSDKKTKQNMSKQMVQQWCRYVAPSSNTSQQEGNQTRRSVGGGGGEILIIAVLKNLIRFTGIFFFFFFNLGKRLRVIVL